MFVKTMQAKCWAGAKETIIFTGETAPINVGRIYWSTRTPSSQQSGDRPKIKSIGRAAHKNVGRKFSLQSAKLEPMTL